MSTQSNARPVVQVGKRQVPLPAGQKLPADVIPVQEGVVTDLTYLPVKTAADQTSTLQAQAQIPWLTRTRIEAGGRLSLSEGTRVVGVS